MDLAGTRCDPCSMGKKCHMAQQERGGKRRQEEVRSLWTEGTIGPVPAPRSLSVTLPDIG